VTTIEGTPIDRALVRAICGEEVARLEARSAWAPKARLAQARQLFEDVALSDELVEFLTVPGQALVRADPRPA
ncbi:MAG: hypothetical protein ACRDK0_05075, partial [Solirubrobacteraceae bacterium]